MSTNTLQKNADQAAESSARGERFVPAGDPNNKGSNTMILDVTTQEGQEQRREVIVMKQWDDGTIYYIDPSHLDTIDRKRMARALARAKRSNLELWEVLRDTAISNGSNGLDYFHQLVNTYRPKNATKAPSSEQLSNVIARDRDLAIERAGPVPLPS